MFLKVSRLRTRAQSGFLLVQDVHELFAGDGFLFVQVLRQLIEFRAVFGQNLRRLLVLLLDDGDDQRVNARLRSAEQDRDVSPPR